MRIGELARRSGLSRDTIRFYERKGLLDSAPSRQKSNTYRDYPEEAVDRLEMITQARGVGFSVADLQKLLKHLSAMRTRAFDAEGFLDVKLAELRALITRSKNLIAMLEQTRTALRNAPRKQKRGPKRSPP